jgi:hypothetical protein
MAERDAAPQITRARPGLEPPIDARVIATSPAGARIAFTIGLPREVEDGHVTARWTGLFLAAGQPIAGTAFKLSQVSGHVARAELVATTLPADAVRLFEPGYSR